MLGRNFFPTVDAGQILMHARVPVGTRVEEAANQFTAIQRAIREIIPSREIATLVDNVGMPVSGINMTYNNTGVIGSQDGDIQIKLTEHHAPTADYVSELRRQLPERFPGVTFSFLPADIISQILNFGSPAPIDVQVIGKNLDADQAYAAKLLRDIRQIPGVADPRIQQSMANPALKVEVDRTRMNQLGLTELDVTTSVGAMLAGTSQSAPTFWVDPKNGASYPIVAQTPQHQLSSVADLANAPVTGHAGAGSAMQPLGGLGVITRSRDPAVVNHYDIEPVIDIYATTQGRDLGGVAHDIQKALKAHAGEAPKGATVHIRGQVATMNTAFSGLLVGLAGAIVLIYLLIVVNFQSWTDPFVIITALPAALAGIVWMLFATGTPLSVPALTGAIMCMGVATANSILVVSFARERLEVTGNAITAALEAGFSRFRPVLMTALAMIIGMAPMALGMGEGGEQNAPLGRAVIGGLLFATFATLVFVPVVFSLAHRHGAVTSPSPATGHDPDQGEIYAA